MKGILFDEFIKIPVEATSATVYGVSMQIIDVVKAREMLDADPNDDVIHECLLSNGRFLFETYGHTLKSLFKVMD